MSTTLSLERTFRLGLASVASHLSWAWVALSSVAIAALFGGQYIEGLSTVAARTPEVDSAALVFSHRAWPIEGGLILHIVFASLALALGPWQFSRWLRTRHPRVHRVMGRAYLSAVALGAVGGIVTSIYSTLGLKGFFGFAALDVLWVWTAYRAYRAVRAQNFREHEAWMIRNFALTYAAVTLRLEFALLLLVQLPFHAPGGFAHAYEQAYGSLPYVAWIPNLVIAEFIIRSRNLPALRMTDPSRPVEMAQETAASVESVPA